MLKKIALGFVVVLGGLMIYAATLPNEVYVVREMKIAAPADVIFSHLNDPLKMNAWNPWMKLDPKVTLTYSGPKTGIGAASTWVGNSDVGSGTATIVESVQNSKVVIRLDYLEPFEASNFTEFALTPTDGQINVSWSIRGKNNFIQRFVCLFMNMDKMVGGTFEKGLIDLKQISENKT